MERGNNNIRAESADTRKKKYERWWESKRDRDMDQYIQIIEYIYAMHDTGNVNVI